MLRQRGFRVSRRDARGGFAGHQSPPEAPLNGPKLGPNSILSLVSQRRSETRKLYFVTRKKCFRTQIMYYSSRLNVFHILEIMFPTMEIVFLASRRSARAADLRGYRQNRPQGPGSMGLFARSLSRILNNFRPCSSRALSKRCKTAARTVQPWSAAKACKASW